MKKIIICLMMFSLSACKSNLEKVELKEEDGSRVEYTRKKDTYAKQGLLIRYYPEGGKFEEAHYSNDQLDGKRTIYFSSGKLQIIEHYKAGAFEGPYQLFHENGQVQLEGNYVNNTMSGEWKGYYETGQLKEIVNFENNEENGPFIEYHENGNLKAEGTYLDGDNEHGELKLYDKSGALEKTMDCVKGVCRTSWTREEK